MFGENRKICVRDARYEAVAIGSSKRPGVRSPPDSGARPRKTFAATRFVGTPMVGVRIPFLRWGERRQTCEPKGSMSAEA